MTQIFKFTNCTDCGRRMWYELDEYDKEELLEGEEVPAYSTCGACVKANHPGIAGLYKTARTLLT